MFWCTNVDCLTVKEGFASQAALNEHCAHVHYAGDMSIVLHLVPAEITTEKSMNRSSVGSLIPTLTPARLARANSEVSRQSLKEYSNRLEDLQLGYQNDVNLKNISEEEAKTIMLNEFRRLLESVKSLPTTTTTPDTFRQSHVSLLYDIRRAMIACGENPSPNENPLDRYQLLRHVTRTTLGGVFCAHDTLTNEQVAVKYQTLQTEQQCKKDPLSEALVLQKLGEGGGHPNVLKLIATHHYVYFWIVTPWACDSSLIDMVLTGERLRTLQEAKNAFKQIVQGVSFMHEKGYAHLDMKLDNVLGDNKGNFLVTSFGLAVETKGALLIHDNRGSKTFMDPDIFSYGQYNPLLADSWSLGVVLFSILSGGIPPFECPIVSDKRFVLLCKDVFKLITAYGLVDKFPADAVDLLRKTFCFNSSTLNEALGLPDIARLTPTQMLEHPFLKS